MKANDENTQPFASVDTKNGDLGLIFTPPQSPFRSSKFNMTIPLAPKRENAILRPKQLFELHKSLSSNVNFIESRMHCDLE